MKRNRRMFFHAWAVLLLTLFLVACGQKNAPETTVPVTTVPETTVAEPTEPKDPVLERAKEMLAGMNGDEKICQLFLVTQDQLTGISGVTRSGSVTQAALERYPVGGVIYFSPNLVSREQTAEMIRDLQSYAEIPMFISVDEEGGIVSRLGRNRKMGVEKVPNMGVIGADGDPEKAYQVGLTLGSELSELGFNLDFAPVADVNSNPRNPVIGERAFHSDPQTVAALVAACVEGFYASGVNCTLKHFPGHGDTDSDSHLGEVRLDKSLEELWASELIPFAAGIEAGAPLVMVGHITVPALSGEAVPATLSREIVTNLLRQQMGFEGIIITDSMQMGAITDRYDSGQAAVLALQAGADIILMPNDLEMAVSGVRQALDSGALSWDRIDDSVLRILETKLRSGVIPMEGEN